MSIYAVRLSEWYPVGDERHDIAIAITKIIRCFACDKKVRWRAAIGPHSLPWGYGDLWCSWKCRKSGKEAKPDWRRERRHKRHRSKNGISQFIKIPKEGK